jgi:hypothetical protein
MPEFAGPVIGTPWARASARESLENGDRLVDSFQRDEHVIVEVPRQDVACDAAVGQDVCQRGGEPDCAKRAVRRDCQPGRREVNGPTSTFRFGDGHDRRRALVLRDQCRDALPQLDGALHVDDRHGIGTSLDAQRRENLRQVGLASHLTTLARLTRRRPRFVQVGIPTGDPCPSNVGWPTHSRTRGLLICERDRSTFLKLAGAFESAPINRTTRAADRARPRPYVPSSGTDHLRRSPVRGQPPMLENGAYGAGRDLDLEGFERVVARTRAR